VQRAGRKREVGSGLKGGGIERGGGEGEVKR